VVLDVELEPAAVPRPKIGGGANASTSASFDLRRLHEHLADELVRRDRALVPVLLRDEDRRGVIAIAAADEVEAVNAIAFWFAGLERIASTTCATTRSVRSSVAPSGRITP